MAGALGGTEETEINFKLSTSLEGGHLAVCRSSFRSGGEAVDARCVGSPRSHDCPPTAVNPTARRHSAVLTRNSGDEASLGEWARRVLALSSPPVSGEESREILC